MYQFFVEPGQIHIEEKRVEIFGPDVNHIRNVLRMKPGEELSVSNGQDGREYRCGILFFGSGDGEEGAGQDSRAERAGTDRAGKLDRANRGGRSDRMNQADRPDRTNQADRFSRTNRDGSVDSANSADRVVCELRFIKEDKIELPARIHLFQALPKADKMELIVQKAVELGAYRIIPVAAKRCVVKLDEKKAASRTARWQGIAEAAAKQSRRAIVPEVGQILSFADAVEMASGMDVKLIPYELAGDMSRTRTLLEEIRPGQDVAVFIGPEGGFEESEAARALAAGIVPVTLGRRILRTETAGMAVLSWMMYLLEGRDEEGTSCI